MYSGFMQRVTLSSGDFEVEVPEEYVELARAILDCEIEFCDLVRQDDGSTTLYSIDMMDIEIFISTVVANADEALRDRIIGDPTRPGAWIGCYTIDPEEPDLDDPGHGPFMISYYLTIPAEDIPGVLASLRKVRPTPARPPSIMN